MVRDIHSPNIPKHANIKVFKGDITEPETINNAIAVERVFHAAGYTKLSAKNPSVFFKVNVEGTRNILEASLKHGVKKLVYTSSGAVFGPSLKTPLCENDPRIVSFESDYDLTKHLAENLIRDFNYKGLYGVIVNPSRVFGPGLNSYSNAINRFISWILFKKLVIVPAIGKVESNYTFIDDVINGHLLAMEKGLAGERYIIGGENISFNELVFTVLSISGQKGNLIKVPIAIMKIAGSLKILQQNLADRNGFYD
ncbi:MAG: NAD-dependent epimerase/dehydratase family protein [Chitinophagaceae bacterium]|nr:NAD-dependent epimerase/dehydratase family protein [Chitinophagaceae bacterium]